MSSLSVVVITRNEQDNIGRCLESVRAIADEMVVVDSGSDDRTVEVATEHGARVVHHPWEGSFTAQKNVALELATSDWVLCLDADESLSSELCEDVRSVLADGGAAAGYSLNRRTKFLGQIMRCWSPDWILRLVRRGQARYVGGMVHEQLKLDEGCAAGRLCGFLEHDTFHTLEQYVERLNRYTTLAAASMFESGKTFRLYKLFLSPPSMFLRMFILKGGWRDGVRGVILCLASGFYEVMKYAKLYALYERGKAS